MGSGALAVMLLAASRAEARDAFQVLEPNESDFLALYNIQKEFDDRWDGVDPTTLSPEEKYQYQQAQNKYDQGNPDH